MTLLSTALYISLALVICKIAFPWIRKFRLKKHVFPSPPGIPFIGNALQVSHTEPWLTFLRWKEQHGPIFSLNMAGNCVVVLNTAKSVTDLLDHRSSIYSDRPQSILAGEILARGLNLGFMHYSDLWRKMRRATHDSLQMHRVRVYQTRQERDAAVLVAKLLSDPGGWYRHFTHASASLALSATYGQQLTETTYSMVESINEIVHALSAAASPANAPWVELFPALRYVPESLAAWKRIGRERSNQFSATFKDYLQSVRERAEVEPVADCLAMSLIDKQDTYGLDDEQSAWLAGSIFGGAAETTSYTLIVFLLAMVLYPDVLKRAQAEVDSVVGRERMPNFDDQSSLPYIDAIIKEMLRWRPAGPLGMGRRCSQDDWYDGHLIPAGATVIANIWAISHDDKVFADPDEFIPERYLEDGTSHGGMDSLFAFGFGRRVCPGRHFAYQNLYILIASIVWAFDITKAIDEQGNEVIPSRTACVNDGIAVRPALFPCQILPRHAGIYEMVQQAGAQAG